MAKLMARLMIVVTLLAVSSVSQAQVQHGADPRVVAQKDSLFPKHKLALAPVYRANLGVSFGGEKVMQPMQPGYFGIAGDAGWFGFMGQTFVRFEEDEPENIEPTEVLKARDVWARFTFKPAHNWWTSGYVGQFDYPNSIGYVRTETAGDLRTILDGDARSMGLVAEIARKGSYGGWWRLRMGQSKEFGALAFEWENWKHFTIAASFKKPVHEKGARFRLAVGGSTEHITLNIISQEDYKTLRSEEQTIWDFASQLIIHNTMDEGWFDSWRFIASSGLRTHFENSPDSRGNVEAWYAAGELDLVKDLDVIKGQGAFYGVFGYNKELPFFGVKDPSHIVGQVGVRLVNDWPQEVW